jgi:hypothetical protein
MSLEQFTENPNDARIHRVATLRLYSPTWRFGSRQTGFFFLSGKDDVPLRLLYTLLI